MGKQSKSKTKRIKAEAPKSGKTHSTESVARVGIKEQALSFRQQFEADIVQFQKASKSDLASVFGYWLRYPLFLEFIGFDSDWGTYPETVGAYHALNHVHTLATDILMKEAAKHGLDPHALYECSRVTKEIYRNDPDLCIRRPGAINDMWPSSMGKARYALPVGQQQALREGEAVFIRLAVKLSLAEEESVGAVAKAVADVLPKLPSLNDTISIAVVLREYVVSRHTVYRYIKDNKIHDYRPKDAPKNSPYLLSRAEIERHFRRN